MSIQIKHVYEPLLEQRGVRTISVASWKNDDVRKALEQVFHVKANKEILVGIEVTQEGIRAEILTKTNG